MFSSFSSSLSSAPFLPLPIILAFLFAEFVLLFFLNYGSELLFPRVELASLFFLGVVIKFSLLEVLSLSVA